MKCRPPPLLPTDCCRPSERSAPTMPTLRQAFDAGGSLDAGGSHFSFVPPTTGKSQGTWTQRVKGGYGYFSRSNDVEPGAWAWGNAGSRSDPSMVDGEELKGLTRPEDGHLGGTSPVLLGKARPARLIPVYPSSQSQAMVRYRQEMMELVRGVPESAYELSLRDLVEVPRMARPEREEDVGKGGGGAPEVATGRDKKKGKKAKSGKKQILRSTSMDSGVFLLKMFFPPSLGGKGRSGAAGIGSKVSPRPALTEGEKGRPEKSVDGELLEGCGEKSKHGGINRSGQRRKMMGCYPFSINVGRIR